MTKPEQGPAIDPEAMRRLARSWSDTGTDWMRNFGQWALARDAEATRLEQELAKLVRVLPGVRYMDPPDGGSVTILEQFERMRDDLERQIYDGW